MEYNSEHLREDFEELQIISINENGLLIDVDGIVYFENPYSVDLKQCEAYTASRELEKIFYNRFDDNKAYTMFRIISNLENDILLDKLEELKTVENIQQIYRIIDGK